MNLLRNVGFTAECGIKLIVPILVVLLPYLRDPQYWFVSLYAGLILIIYLVYLYFTNKNKYTLAALLITILFILFLVVLHFYPEFTKPQIEIKSHKDGSEVTQIQNVSGISRNIPSTSEIWVVIYAHSPTNRYYPQLGPVIPNDGSWSEKDINIGDPNDIAHIPQ